MNIEILEKLHFILTLVFGIALSVSFLGIHKQRAARFKIGLFIIVSIIMQQLVYNYFDSSNRLEYFLRYYPFYIHLPLVLFLVFVFRAPCLSTITAVTIAYSCCQLTQWLGFVGVIFIQDQ